MLNLQVERSSARRSSSLSFATYVGEVRAAAHDFPALDAVKELLEYPLSLRQLVPRRFPPRSSRFDSPLDCLLRRSRRTGLNAVHELVNRSEEGM